MIYRLRSSVVAFRNDFCLTCMSERRAIQIRSFNILCFEMIPLLPVGFWKRWQCLTCSRDPGYNPRSRRKFAITLALLAGAFAAIFWGLEIEPGQEAIWMLIRIASPIVLVGAIIWALAADPTPSTAERLARVAPAGDFVCPFCQRSLLPVYWSCPNCGVQRR
jgi:hypothetical protein